MIASKAPDIIMDLIKMEYHIKGERTPEYYLGKYLKTYKGRYDVVYNKYSK